MCRPVFLLAVVLFTHVGVNEMLVSQEWVRGVSQELARQRKNSVSNVEYELYFDLKKKGPIQGSVKLTFELKANTSPLVVDFNAPEESVIRTLSNSRIVEPLISQGHIVVAARDLQKGKNTVEIEFVAGDQSLNRNENFLYTLLVPDRASTVFPCFDQPDIKGKFKLSLSLPEGWVASANGARVKVENNRWVFKQTRPISTYLFAFAAGEFQSITREINGRKVTMWHRESDEEKVKRNVDDIFRIHAFSLEWLEEYTAIDYPFDKFDFVLIPSFQYGGMEHIGNIFYNANSLFLDKTATQNQKLNRASLIAHETAHMWFGNLVTMKWFNDVWLKEVFANFMAAKIVNPSFPEINHKLGFMLKHHPSAYGEDRTRGTYPIQQKLENLRDAGTLYGRIIYMKAPIVMRQLETIIGPQALRDGLREYLTKFSYDNAVWDDLISILDKKTEVDLNGWSESWVKEPGTPEIQTRLDGAKLAIEQKRKTAGQKYWAQQIDIKVVSQGKTVKEVRTLIDGESTSIDLPELSRDYDFYLTNGSELGYGYFRLDKKSKSYLLEHVHEVDDDVTRGAAWMALYESMVRGETRPEQYMATLVRGLKNESETLNRQNLLSQLSVVYWKFLSANARAKVAAQVESVLWNGVKSSLKDDARSAYFKSLVGVVTEKNSVEQLFEIWKEQSEVFGLPLSENDLMTLAYELAIRMPDRSAEILDTQLERIQNEDRKKRFRFVMPALSADPTVRHGFFERLNQAQNRRPERWVLEGLQYLHHPLRAAESEKYIFPSLELLEEIQLTGDIFFPKRWLVATLGGHRSKSAADVVTRFLGERPEYPYRLKNKILQAADLLLKVADRESVHGGRTNE